MGGCWPTATQKLLLRACLIDGPGAIENWQQWQELTDVEHLDDGSSRLLPLLWRNLHAQGAQGAQGEALTRYKSMSRWIWVRNQKLVSAATRVIEILESDGIATLVLKGGALAPLYYPSLSARPMSDFDLLVPTAQAPRAFELLMRRGYCLKGWNDLAPTADESRIADVLSVFHGAMVRDPAGQEFDLHQHVLKDFQDENADEDFWAASIPLQLGATKTRALCAEDALYHVCAHGVAWNDVPPLRWIADATLILRGTPDFNWNRVVKQCRRHGQTIMVRQALRYLNELDIGVIVPAATLQQLQAIATSRAQRRLWRTLSTSHHSRSAARSLWLRAHYYFAWNARQPWHLRPFSFARYIKSVWGLESYAQMAARIGSSFAKKRRAR